jgi:hypothetical protein
MRKEMKQPISLIDVKQALRDDRFRNSLPDIFKEDLNKFMSNPGCGCNIGLYKRLLAEAKPQLQEYFPDKEVVAVEDQVSKLSQNNFSIINCSINELESRLRSLSPGRKQLAISRYEDQVTVVINELDFVY